MDDPRNRRDLGLICIGAVMFLIGTAVRMGSDDPTPLADESVGETIGVVLAAVGAWTCLICLALIGVRLIRSR